MTPSTGQTAGLSVEDKRALLAELLRAQAEARGTSPAGGNGSLTGGGAHRLIDAQCRRTPEAVAVRCEGRTLTYAELARRAGRLAQHLRTLGVGPGSLVAVCLERSEAMVVSLLAVLQAGGAYVPIDPAYPDARIRFMLDDALPAVLLTERTLREALPEARDGLAVVCVDSEWETLDTPPDPAPGVTVRPDDLAYVIYTSGSTGRPKGVQVTHGGLAAFLKAMRSALGIVGDDALLAVTTLSFDIAALELFLPLTVGARVELATRGEAIDGAGLAARLAEASITFLQATPATWRMLLEAGWEGTPGLTMLCGGEALPRALADRLLPRGKALWNLYGPTETTIWSSLARVEPGDAPITIGRPIAGTQLYVLDARLRPVPVGVTGELYIGGAGVARGYLGRPSLTAERFLPDPHGKTPGGRIYRTGDLARWRNDGTLECLGRVDHQVKVRGFRVELGEVEAALAGHPEVREAAVTTRDDATGEPALVAFLAHRGTEPGVADLRRWLLASLPEYMVPSAFVFLDALPLTPNGKIDRNALPDHVAAIGASAAIYVPPRGPVEDALAAVWAELLGRDRVGVYDNFFELGGHSLLATRMLARVRDLFSVDPPLRDVLEHPTVAGVARLVERELAAGSGLHVPPIVPVDRAGPQPASFAQQRLWFLDQLEPGNPTYNIPTAVRLQGPLDVAALTKALTEVVRRHEVLRTTFASRAGVPHQVIGPALPMELPLVDLSDLPGSEREAEAKRRVDAEALRPFDLARGPLVRGVLIRLAEETHVVVVTMHHIASDGWSVGVLVTEVAALYEAFLEGRPSPLDEPALQYADYAAWQRGWLAGEVLDQLLGYWRGRLAGVPNLELPTDRPRPAVPSLRGGVRHADWPKELGDALRDLGRAEGATLFMTLLAAFEVLLHRHSGQADFAVGTPIAGRTRSELEGLIGFFVNTLVLRVELEGDPGFRELLRRVRREALGGFTHQDAPFEQLVGALRPDRDASRTPLFQAMFVLQNAPLPPLRSPGMELTVLEPAGGTAKFDLTLFCSETEGGLRVTMEYAADLFEAATVERMLGHLRTLAEGIVADPDRPVSALPMLTEAERQALLCGSGTAADGWAVDLDDLSDEDLDAMLTNLSAGEGVTDE